MSIGLSLNVFLGQTFRQKFLRGLFAPKILPEDFELAANHILDIGQDDNKDIVNGIEVPLVDFLLVVANLAEVDLDNVRTKSRGAEFLASHLAHLVQEALIVEEILDELAVVTEAPQNILLPLVTRCAVLVIVDDLAQSLDSSV